MANDPAGLLQRIAELQPLASDPKIARAIGTGDPFKVYRALVFARLTGRLAAHRRTLDVLVRNRRAFARPLKKSLWLGRVNGFGATLLGNAEAEADGTRIATHYVVAFFVVPLFPLGAYVVGGGERSGLSASWSIFARVPLAVGTWLWSRAIAAAAAVAVVLAAASAVHATRHHDLHVVNGFAQPVEVAIGDQHLQVPAHGHVVVNLPVGTLPARATAGGDVVDDGPVAIAAGSATQVWNVAGAAPVVHVQVEYVSDSVPKDANAAPPTPTILCGTRFASVPGVDFAFVPAPKSVSMPEHAQRVSKRWLGVDDGAGEDQPRACANWMAAKGRLADGVALLEARARLAGWAADETRELLGMAQLLEPADAARVSGRVRDAKPEEVLAHRVYQGARVRSGEEAAVLDEYRQRAEAAPGSATAQYLHARLLHGAEQVKAADVLSARFPDDPDVLRLAVSLRCSDGDFARADAGFRSLLTRHPEAAAEVIDDETVALVALGRAPEALALLRTVYGKIERTRALSSALYARVARLAHDSHPEALVEELEKQSGPWAELRARAGLPIPKELEPSPAARVMRAAGRDLPAALEAADGLAPNDASSLDPATWALVYGEAVRNGRAPARDALRKTPFVVGAELDAFDRFVRGEESGPLAGIPLEVRAAAELVRSRNAALPAAERAALAAAARRDDWLATNVTEALRSWPAPDATR